MEEMFLAIKDIADERQDIKVLYPVHLNPQVKELAHKILDSHERIHLCDPLNVFDCHNIIAHSYIVLTDAGGLQEEAPSLNIPVLVMRNTTERPEGVKSGTLKLVGTKREDIKKHIYKLLDDIDEYKSMSKSKNPYGDGKAAKRIVKLLLNEFYSQSF